MGQPAHGPTLGIVAISYNEERDLPGFINHLESWVDEIVIVDDGSTDTTQAIAQSGSAKIKFIKSPRTEGEYFSHQRNKGIDAATSDWLLHMDIDERVPPDLAVEIREAIARPDKEAYRYRRLNFFLHRPMKGGGWQDWNLVHLAKRSVLRFGGMYHEDCLVSLPDERIGQLDCAMWHLNDDTYIERMTKSNLYCQEQAVDLAKTIQRIGAWHMLWVPAKDFLKKFFFKQGYRDGVLGLLFALHSATATFRACAILWDQQYRVERSVVEEDLERLWRRA
jgi:glycosyltransferase involved in cell wall biosynthesis